MIVNELALASLQQGDSERNSLVTWDAAARKLDDFFNQWEATLLLNVDRYVTDNRRAWMFKRAARRMIRKMWGVAHFQLLNDLLPQNRKRTGVQDVQTTKWVPTATIGNVEFMVKSGHTAWKRKRGRPSLSATMALEHMLESIKKRRARNKTDVVHIDRKPLSDYSESDLAETDSPRPSRGELVEIKKRNRGGRGPTSQPTISDLKDEVLREMLQKVGEGLGEFIAAELIETFKTGCARVFSSASGAAEPSQPMVPRYEYDRNNL